MSIDNIIVRSIRQMRRELRFLVPVLRCKLYEIFRTNCLIVKAPIICDPENGMVHYNWGDDMNVFFLELISGKNVEILPDTRIAELLRIKNYICIGSTLSFFYVNNSYIWGSGIINEHQKLSLRGTPRRVCAVRGPLSREWLLEQGVDCPEIYGDPILLMPLFYNPVIKEKNRIGIVPHYDDIESQVISDLVGQHGGKLILTRNYAKWQDFVDEICSCEIIFSSSLHGLIVAYAYGIPSVWIEKENVIDGWETKFNDFYYSINLRNVSPCILHNGISLEQIKERVIDYTEACFDMNKLIKSCPFDLDLSRIECL